ncbi:nucleoside recognition protein [Metallumcola ferriviriculae]|uniref:Nucleoside recognition protein n=1 Tax=Metallumcola ferriviriculae TaxID=3039180 RepID=A0AAU0UIJ0_9FIRM|nr:nucleoside recognition protein [Desulfitibacteraceae bacterium MK1]
MDFVRIFAEAIQGSSESILSIALIVFPLMVALEIAKDLDILEWMSRLISPISRLFKVPDEAGLPLLAGLIFGIAYGAGAIIQSAKEGKLSQRDLLVVNTFLVICHSVFEDTMLFVAIGANGWLILLFRLVTAIILTFALSRYTLHKNEVSNISSRVTNIK